MSEPQTQVRNQENPASPKSLCACYNLRRTSRAVSRFYDHCLATSGLRSTQFSMLLALKNRGPLGLGKLAEITLTERTTLTRNLGLLERQGLIRSQPGQDRREREISLAPPGLAALGQAMPLWEKAQNAITQGLGQERLNQLLLVLEDVIQSAKL